MVREHERTLNLRRCRIKRFRKNEEVGKVELVQCCHMANTETAGLDTWYERGILRDIISSVFHGAPRVRTDFLCPVR